MSFGTFTMSQVSADTLYNSELPPLLFGLFLFELGCQCSEIGGITGHGFCLVPQSIEFFATFCKHCTIFHCNACSTLGPAQASFHLQTVGFADQDDPGFCFLPMNLGSRFTHKLDLRGLMHNYSVSWLYDFFKHEY